MIAYDHTQSMCQACPSHVGCQERVEGLRPKIIALLDRFSDANGREMSHAWLTKGERKARKKALVDGSIVQMNLEPPTDQRNAAKVARAARAKLDPRTCHVRELGALSKHMGVVVDAIARAPRSQVQIADVLQEYANLTPGSAKRTAQREISFLITAGRARYAGPYLELV